MHYVLIQGPSYRGLDFEAREKVREKLRETLEARGIRFVQYDWVWDEEDRCLLLVGQYQREDDARYWIDALESMGFIVLVRTQLPGEETERTTRTGIKITLRPVRVDDKNLLQSFFESLSDQAIYLRFFRHVEASEDLLQRLVHVDPEKQIALLALVRSEEKENIVGVGRCFIDRSGRTAELILTVGDEYQNKGIGRELLLHLISLVRTQRLKGLTAQVLADNLPMLRLLRSLQGVEYDIERRLKAGVFHFDMTFVDGAAQEEPGKRSS
jgi:RimJ/RimL family protein N-acetyltransferase